MPLPLPDLDTRRWVDLVDEARALIPRYAPDWTDHNAHDPGITLVELLAWLVELDVYQLNRVPESHKRKFLSLVGMPPLPPRAAAAVLSMAPPAGPAPTIPAGTEFAATGPDGRAYLFRALRSLSPVPSTLQTVLVEAVAGTLQDATRLWREQGSFAAFGDDPRSGSALWLGFDQPLPAGQPVRLAFTFAGGRGGADERRRIVEEAAAQQESCRRPLPPAPPCATPTQTPSAAPALPLQHHSVRLTWQFRGSGGWTALDPSAGQVIDDTRALALDGCVELTIPGEMAAVSRPGEPPRYFVRVVVASGEYDSPPQASGIAFNAVPVEQAVPVSRAFTIAATAAVTVEPGASLPDAPGRARVTMRLDPAGVITALTFAVGEDVPEHTVLYYRAPDPAAGRTGVIMLDLALLGRSTGMPGQAFPLPHAPVQGDSLELFTLEPEETAGEATARRDWQVRPDLDASSGRDPDVVLDESAGEVTFGDGDRGRIPPVGAAVFVRYRATAGAAGNLAAGLITAIAPTLGNWRRFDRADCDAVVASQGLGAVLAADPGRVWQQLSAAGYAAVRAWLGAIANPHPAAGGAPAETVAQAAGRAVLALRAPSRAITAADYEHLALETPGTVIARARALPGRHPSYPCLAAPGVVTVIVVPDQRREQPLLSPGLRDAVRRYLDRRRILGTRVEVVGPRYLVVRVIARVQPLPGASPERVRADIGKALAAFLNPLTGGPAAIAPAVTAAVPPPPAPPPVTGVVSLAPTPAPAPVVPAPPRPAAGWPFGRDVYRSEVMQVIDGVAGVDNVLSLEMTGNGGPAQCGNLCVGPTELVTSGQHAIEVV